MKDLIPTERIERAILLIRGQKVILDTDLARLYGVTTKRLNEQVKRNRRRWPGLRAETGGGFVIPFRS